MTSLVIRHHLHDDRLQAAVSDAPWTSAAGFADVRSTRLLDAGPLEHDADSLTIVLVDRVDSDEDAQRLCDAVLALADVGPTMLVGATVEVLPALAEAAGLLPDSWAPRHEVRVRPEPGVDPRLLDDLLVTARLLLPEKVADDVSTLATANVGFRDFPVVTYRAGTGVGAVLADLGPAAWAERGLLRFLRHVAATTSTATARGDIGVGMIGYGAIGHEHALATQAVPGLALAAVSDLNPARVAVARSAFGDVPAYADADDLLADDRVEVVVVSTPPNTHGAWARRALEAGKHVVLEKPMALTAAECDEAIAAAESADRLLVVYQNRRFDPDYLVLRRLVEAGEIGEVFHVESFVGGYGHPCNYWHSDAAVSGGAIFDWGSHYIDQLLDLMPGEIAAVTATNHKRRWHDVTNADHSRVTIHFTDGREAQFIHSDLAAAPKPKWWVLGTTGAVRGDWRTERVVSRSAIGTLDEDVMAPADSPAAMSLHHPDGSVTTLAVPSAPAFAFHRELADHLLRGLPMTVRAEQSRRVVAVMEAAEQSAATASSPVALP